jgi:hypothetical protein
MMNFTSFVRLSPERLLAFSKDVVQRGRGPYPSAYASKRCAAGCNAIAFEADLGVISFAVMPSWDPTGLLAKIAFNFTTRGRPVSRVGICRGVAEQLLRERTNAATRLAAADGEW